MVGLQRTDTKLKPGTNHLDEGGKKINYNIFHPLQLGFFFFGNKVLKSHG